VLEANPNFRDEYYPESSSPEDRAYAKFKGRKLPLVGRVEISIIEESNPRMLAFEQGDLDYVAVPPDLVSNVLDPGNKLKPRLAKDGITLARGVQPAITYSYFNMEGPDRRRIHAGEGRAAPRDRHGVQRRRGGPRAALGPGGARDAASSADRDRLQPQAERTRQARPAAARALLDKFGYVDRDKDGWRDLPDGKPLVLKIANGPNAIDRQYAELWQKSMSAVGLRVEFNTQKFATT
jgi:ABC-type transport system substrate-binding protein